MHRPELWRREVGGIVEPGRSHSPAERPHHWWPTPGLFSLCVRADVAVDDLAPSRRWRSEAFGSPTPLLFTQCSDELHHGGHELCRQYRLRSVQTCPRHRPREAERRRAHNLEQSCSPTADGLRRVPYGHRGGTPYRAADRVGSRVLGLSHYRQVDPFGMAAGGVYCLRRDRMGVRVRSASRRLGIGRGSRASTEAPVDRGQIRAPVRVAVPIA